jgi:hypothetical protein
MKYYGICSYHMELLQVLELNHVRDIKEWSLEHSSKVSDLSVRYYDNHQVPLSMVMSRYLDPYYIENKIREKLPSISHQTEVCQVPLLLQNRLKMSMFHFLAFKLKEGKWN